MAAFNQVPLGQTSIVTTFTDHVTGSAANSSSLRTDLTTFRLTGNLGQPTKYLEIFSIQPKWRRETKMIGTSP